MTRRRANALWGPIPTALSAALLVAGGCASAPRSPRAPTPETVSLLGRPLYALSEGEHPDLVENLARARRALAAAPDDENACIWHGRRLGYLWKIHEAIAAFSKGIERRPGSPRLLRHRGHRYITLRQFEAAIADLERAAELSRQVADEVEPDGAPNERGIPLTTTGFNIWYHLALARYLEGDYEGALRAWRATTPYAQRYDDNRVAVAYWTCLTLWKLGRDAEAREQYMWVRPDLDMIENHAYHRLLLLFRGDLSVEQVLPPDAKPLDVATTGYGVAGWRRQQGDQARAVEALERVVQTDSWPAFGFIAAEVELARRAD